MGISDNIKCTRCTLEANEAISILIYSRLMMLTESVLLATGGTSLLDNLGFGTPTSTTLGTISSTTTCPFAIPCPWLQSKYSKSRPICSQTQLAYTSRMLWFEPAVSVSICLGQQDVLHLPCTKLLNSNCSDILPHGRL